MARKRDKVVSRKKAGKILRHGTIRGEPITKRQKGLFGLIRGGGTPTRLRGRGGRRRVQV